MAAQQPPPPPPQQPNVITRGIKTLLAEEGVSTRVLEMKKSTDRLTTALTMPDEDFPDTFDYSDLVGCIFTALNGSQDMQEQRVRVAYLASDQMLVLPAALVLHPTDQTKSDTPYRPEIVQRYFKSATLTYAQIAEMMDDDRTMAQRRATVDATVLMPNVEIELPWNRNNYYTTSDGHIEDPEVVAVTMGLYSKMLLLNCDVRDIGMLVLDGMNMRCADGDWSTAENTPLERLRPKLKPYTIECIAALNYIPCGSWPLGAWIRAFGVSCGVLPDDSTRLNREWKYTRAAPQQAHRVAVRTVHSKVSGVLSTLCMNLLAMFGLLHLNKNHTFKTGDPNMERVCVSYIQALRTMVDSAVIDDLKANMEVACRTAAHPFGLGQTYWVARSLKTIRALASPLAKRTDVCPPLVQRLMIVDAATKEWQALPVGALLNSLFAPLLTPIQAEIARVRACPPAYSELHDFYAIEHFVPVSAEAIAGANSLMPIVCGFAQAMHTDESGKKDGLALAMSFLNVERDAKTATTTYAHLWTNYVEEMDTGGLEKFIKKAFNFANVGLEGSGGGQL